MKPSITYSETCELSGVPIRISAALNSSSNESVLEQFFIKESCMSAQVTNEVAYFSSDTSISVKNERLKFIIDISLVDVLIEIL
jgi:hypothetical protein